MEFSIMYSFTIMASCFSKLHFTNFLLQDLGNRICSTFARKSSEVWGILSRMERRAYKTYALGRTWFFHFMSSIFWVYLLSRGLDTWTCHKSSDHGLLRITFGVSVCHKHRFGLLVHSLLLTIWFIIDIWDDNVHCIWIQNYFKKMTSWYSSAF